MGRAFEYRRAAKEKRWANMSKVFPKLAKIITHAAKEGGGDPDMNPKLRTAILNAKAQNMPKDNIDAAIKRALGKDASDISLMNYEGKGPHGVMIIVECATDNPTRTVANIKVYFSKAGGQLLPPGSLEFMFTTKSVFEVENSGLDLEELELDLIDHGLDEIEEDGDTLYIYGGYTDFGTLSKAIEEKGLKVNAASLQKIPNSPQEFTNEQLEEIDRLIEKIEEDDDVQAVYTNIA